MAFEDLGDRYNSGFGREIDDNINRNQGGDGGRRRPPQTPPPLDEPPVVVQKPFSRLAQKIIDGNPQNTDYELGQNTTFINPDEKIKIRKVDLNNLGTAGQLGTGDYVLESLYLKTHKNNPNRQPINTGRTDENGNPILIPTVRAGMGNLNGLDIKGYSSDEIFYRGSDRGDEPYQIASIGSEPNDPVPNGTSRLLTFYNSDAGRNLVVRDNLLQFIHNNPPKFSFKKARKLTFARVGDIIQAAGIGLLAARFQPGHNALLSNLILNRATLDIKDRRLFEIGGQSVNLNQVLGALGTSVGNIFGGVRNRFSVGYSARTRTGQPFGNLGDKPWNLSFLQRVKKVSIDAERDGQLRTYLRKQQNRIHNVGIKESERIGNQTVRKITPFMDLTGKGNHDEYYKVGPVEVRAHGYDDRISNSGIEYEETGPPLPISSLGIYSSDDPAAIIPPKPPLEEVIGIGQSIDVGDFYVRFKDLRDGGYIYFRGYINGITENLSPSWTPTNYIGRSEPVYSYERAERDISFNLAVYPQNNKEEEFMYKKMNRLTSMVYPEYMADSNSVTRMKPPFTEMYMAHIGDKQKGKFGYIKSLSYTVNESGDWNALENLPRVFNIAISYQIVSKRPPSLDTQFYQSGEVVNG